jgi:uncharacterized protein
VSAPLRPFHLAFPVDDLEAARGFYVGLLGCSEGRSAADWIDFDLYGHQIVAHRVDRAGSDAGTNPVDGQDVPVPHFGIVLTTRFKGEAGEQSTMFFRDPAGNALEFKAFADDAMLFAV